MPNFSVTPACWIESIKPCCRCSMKVRQNKMVRFSRYQLKTMRKIRKEYCLKKKVVISRNYYYYSFKTLPALSKQFSPFSPNAHKIVWKKTSFHILFPPRDGETICAIHQYYLLNTLDAFMILYPFINLQRIRFNNFTKWHSTDA